MPKWEKHPDETFQAFKAFSIYRDMGLSRSLPKVAAKTLKSLSLMKRWSLRWSWVERAAAWDAELDRISVEAQKKARVEMAERHIEQAMLFQEKIIERLKTLEPDDLSPAVLIRWLEAAVKIERLSRGEPTEIDKQNEITLKLYDFNADVYPDKHDIQDIS
jgi:glycine/D-amino acid oxidase-like deaminating enzyme